MEMPGVLDHSAVTSSRGPTTAHPSTSRPGPTLPIPPGLDATYRSLRASSSSAVIGVDARWRTSLGAPAACFGHREAPRDCAIPQHCSARDRRLDAWCSGTTFVSASPIETRTYTADRRVRYSGATAPPFFTEVEHILSLQCRSVIVPLTTHNPISSRLDVGKRQTLMPYRATRRDFLAGATACAFQRARLPPRAETTQTAARAARRSCNLEIDRAPRSEARRTDALA